MLLSFLLYGACAVAAAGLLSLIRPLRFLGVRNRWVALLVATSGIAGAWTVLVWPARETLVTSPQTALDEFAPAYQFAERHEIPVRASKWDVYDAIKTVSADEIPLYRELVWIRRGGHVGPESILNPPDGVPLITVATRTSFMTLAERTGEELVIGTVVLAPPGVRLALGADVNSFRSLVQPGFAKATINFRIEPMGQGWCRLKTETRVQATDYESRAVFARYWRVIGPGSALIRMMWLRAIKVRAESAASAALRPVSPVTRDYRRQLRDLRRDFSRDGEAPVLR
jgi:hypothetical protein